MSRKPGGLTIGDVAKGTGLSVATLRAWERRYGFPEPHRLASGHRRYLAVDVARIEQVVRDRDAGLSLPRAIERASRPEQASAPSVFAAVRRRHPDLGTQILTARAMRAVSRAIEDESCAQAEQPVLLAGFEREHLYRRSEARWQELARTASLAVVFADFAASVGAGAGPVEVALPRRAPLVREWFVVCHAPDTAAVLAGWELTKSGPEAARRRFEATWSTDPAVVADACATALALARQYAPALVPPAREPETPTAGYPVAGLRRTVALTNRIVAYLDG